MSERQAPKSGRLRGWRERWRARTERARDIERRSKQSRAGDRERYERTIGGGGGSGGIPPGMPGP